MPVEASTTDSMQSGKIDVAPPDGLTNWSEDDLNFLRDLGDRPLLCRRWEPFQYSDEAKTIPVTEICVNHIGDEAVSAMFTPVDLRPLPALVLTARYILEKSVRLSGQQLKHAWSEWDWEFWQREADWHMRQLTREQWLRTI